MAKKKNAPVLRGGGGGGGDQPTITKSYAVRDKWLDKAKDNLVEFKSVDGEISDLKVNGQPAGGGGSMKTYTVNFINNTQSTIYVHLPALDDSNPTDGIYCVLELAPNDNFNRPVVANQEGSINGDFYSEGQPTATGSGDVEVLDTTIFVYGDGSLSFA